MYPGFRPRWCHPIAAPRCSTTRCAPSRAQRPRCASSSWGGSQRELTPQKVFDVSARNRELLGLIPASLLVTAGFAGVFIQRSNVVSNVSLIYGAVFLGLCIAAHVFIRMTLPRADPYMFPLVAVLASFGLVAVYRISPTLARQQAQ